ncbi:MAG: DUF2095 domain-containing protein [Candidatus Methanomethylicota archaeon]|nr:MAG: DUF2095 domain-containing protein [Candidatus Verstraetearchaeota archaeon]
MSVNLLVGVPVVFHHDILKRYFTSLAEELEKSSHLTVKLPASLNKSNKCLKPKFQGYIPTVIDFIRRCDTDEEALEIINFLEKRGKISGSYANALKSLLREGGVRIFGSKKSPGWYFKEDPYFSKTDK